MNTIKKNKIFFKAHYVRMLKKNSAPFSSAFSKALLKIKHEAADSFFGCSGYFFVAFII